MDTSLLRILALPLMGVLPLLGVFDGAAPQHPQISDARDSWEWPISAPHTIQRAYAAPADRYSSGHRGIDITAAVGTPVHSPTAGQVYFVGVVVDRAVLTIRSRDGTLASFEPVTSPLTEGTPVSAGQIVGTVSAGTHCAQSCVHFGVRVNGAYVSPLTYLGGLRYPVLLPTRPRP